MKEITEKILKWASVRGIFAESTAIDQFKKLLEEVEETRIGIVQDDLTEIKDGIGDCFVVLVNLAHFYGLKMEECVNYSWGEIENRKGKMINGQFVKEEK